MATGSLSEASLPNGGTGSSSNTNFKLLECSYTWTIKNFSHHFTRPGETLNSPIFFSATDDKIKWYLSLYPESDNEDNINPESENKDNLVLDLTLVSSYKTEVKVKYSIFIVDENQLAVVCKDAIENTLLQKSDDHKPKCGCPFVSKSYLMDRTYGLLLGDNLSIRCELSASTIIPSTIITSTIIPSTIVADSPKPGCSTSSDLRSERHGFTNLETVDFSFTWTINNFKFCQGNNGKPMISPEFSSGPDSKIKWELKLYPNGRVVKGRKYQKHVQIFLRPTTRNEIDVVASFTISILNSNREKINETSTPQPYTFVKEKATRIGFKEFILRAFLLKNANKLMPNGTLTIVCEISYLKDIVSVSGESKPTTLDKSECSLSNDLKILLEGQKCSDVTLVVRERELRAHKAILAARSSVFLDMFQKETEDRRVNRVEITNLDYEVIKEMLRFIYTGKVENRSGFTGALLVAADKFAIEKLKVVCEEELCSKLGIKNAADMLLLAVEHNADHLKAKTLELINARDSTEVMSSESFKKMFNSHPELIAEVALHRCAALKKRKLE